MNDEAVPHRRRVRYAGKYPRRFEDKYKERDPERFPEVAAKVVTSGKTLAGTHRPIMVEEILAALAPQPGDIAVDCTLGFGGHTERILPHLLPGGCLIGLDADPIELPRTEARLRALGFGPEVFTAHRCNFAGLPKVLAEQGIACANIVLADLGVSSMQFDDPSRGFSIKAAGPLDLRMNPQRGQPASVLLAKMGADELASLLVENADEPHSTELAPLLAGRSFTNTLELAHAIRTVLAYVDAEERELSVRRVFQTLRIAVNDEFGALDTLLRHLPACLAPGGRVAVLTFHSGEDRRVKKAFAAAHRGGLFSSIAREVTRATPEERHANPRSSSAKLRWAIRA